MNSSDVLDLANSIYGTHLLSATDSHTIQCKVTNGVTYIPIPVGSGQNFAGLFTVDLPTTVVAGQEYNIIVKKVSTHGNRVKSETFLKQQLHSQAESIISQNNAESGEEYKSIAPGASLSRQKSIKNWRYITGTFQVQNTGYY